MESTQHPLNSIAGKKSLQEVKAESPPPVLTQLEGKAQPYDNQNSSSPGNSSARTLASIPQSLNLAGLKTPAIIIDNWLRVIWQNKTATEQIWHCSRTVNNGNPTPGIFDLLFDTQFQLVVDNWRQWVSFFANQAAAMVSEEVLQQQLDCMKARQRDVVSAMLARQNAKQEKAGLLGGHLRQVLADGEIRTFNVTAVDFNEGRLLSFVPEASAASRIGRLHSHDIEKRYSILQRQPNPIKIGFSLLSASLNNSRSLETELLSDDFCRLVNDVCCKSIDTVERFGGIFSKHSDSAFTAFFLPADPYEEHLSINAIQCALALKTSAADLSREWKLRRSWLREIELNIGIHRDNGYLGILNACMGDNLTSYGSALDVVSGLSKLSHSGQIWATKSLISDLPLEVRNQLRFGIQRPNGQGNPKFIQSSFAIVQELLIDTGVNTQCPLELEDMAITQVFDLQIAG